MVVVILDDGSFEFKAMRGRAGMPSRDATPSISESAVRKVLETKAPRVVADINRDASLAVAQSVMSLQLGSVVAIPLWRHALAVETGSKAAETTATDDVFGVLYLDSRESRGAFGDLDVGILETLARDASSAIENARLAREAEQKRQMDEELDRAKEVQAALMPDEYWPEPYFEVAGSLVPCLELGGDYLGQFRFPDGRVAFVVADVCGKGVQAALLAAALQGSMVTAIDAGRAYVIPGVAPLPRGDARDYGLGCLTSDGHLPQAEVGGRATVGDEFDVKLRAGPGFPTVAILLRGVGEQSVPLDIIGMPGCSLLLQAPIFVHGTHPVDLVGRANATLLIPRLSNLIGQESFFQWAIVDGPLMPLANPLGLVSSEGIKVTIGAF